MAQYGRNYYGASYYGQSGVFAGQFISDPTNLNTPLTNVAPSDGKLYIDLICAHPRITYTYPNDIFLRSGTWVDGASSIRSSDPNFTLNMNLVGSTIVLNYISRVDGANIDIEVKTYVAGTLVDTQNLTVDTMGAGPYTIQPAQFGEQVIKITKSASSGASEVFEFQDMTVMTTDIRLEMKPKNSDNTWGAWADVPLTADESDVTYNGFSHVYKYTAETPDWTGKKGYQFKMMMASSDNTNTPEVISIDVHTASTNDYSLAGYWKTTIDLTDDISTIDSITYNVTEPEGTKVEIRSRTSDIDGSWSSWTLPYTAATRAILDYKTNPNVTTGYVITPVIDPENLTTWNKYRLKHFLNYIDKFTGATTPGAKILVEIVNKDYNANPQTVDEGKNNIVYCSYTYTNDTQLDKSLARVPEKAAIRLKVTFTRPPLGVASPAVEKIDTLSNAYYKEYRTFGTGGTDLKGYGSAVYGENTGVDNVYTDGTGRTALASISNLAYTIPVGAENPEYVIEIDPTFAETYTAEEVDIYWKSNGSKSVYLESGLTDDNPLVKVKEAREVRRIRNCYRYGSGIVLALDPEYTTINLTNTFSPSLTPGRSYAYYVQNGFLLDTPNDHVDIRWKSENTLDKEDRRNVTYTLNDQIYIGIITGDVKGLVEWVSEEKKISAVVNANDIEAKYVATITDLPEIEAGVIIDPNPAIIPYKVEVIEGSVFSRGQRKDESIVEGTVRYLYASDATPSLVQTVEEKAEVIRGSGNKDYLPKAMVKSVQGVYSQANQYSPYYQKGTDYDYSIPGGSTYSNEIDWSKGIIANTAPDEGDSYFVTYTYDKVVSLRVEFTCDYSEYEPSPQIYRSPVLSFSGQCSPMFDYTSAPMSFTDFVVPTDVDKSTLKFIVYDDNARVRTYVNGNTIVGTLDKRDPRESWNPYVRGGYYYINKDGYYMFTNENVYELGPKLIPAAENISYRSGVNGTGVLIEEQTANILANSKLTRDVSLSNVFTDTFART